MFHHASPRGQFDHENSCPASVLEAISASKVWIEGPRLSSQWKYKCHLSNCWRTTSWYQKMFLFGPWWRPWWLPLTSVFVSNFGVWNVWMGLRVSKFVGFVLIVIIVTIRNLLDQMEQITIESRTWAHHLLYMEWKWKSYMLCPWALSWRMVNYIYNIILYYIMLYYIIYIIL